MLAAQALLTRVGLPDEIKPAPLDASEQLVLCKSKAPIIPQLVDPEGQENSWKLCQGEYCHQGSLIEQYSHLPSFSYYVQSQV